MHANTVFLVGLGLLLVAERGFGYSIDPESISAKRSDIRDTLNRSDDLAELGLRDENESLERAAAGAAAAGRRWYNYESRGATSRSAASASSAGAGAAAAAAAAGTQRSAEGAALRSAGGVDTRSVADAAAAVGAASRAAAAAGAASKFAALAAAAAAAGRVNKRVGELGGRGWVGEEAELAAGRRYGARNDESLRASDELSYIAGRNEKNDITRNSLDYEVLRDAGDDDSTGALRYDSSTEKNLRYLYDDDFLPYRLYDDELQTIDETIEKDADSISKRMLKSAKTYSPTVYLGFLGNVVNHHWRRSRSEDNTRANNWYGARQEARNRSPSWGEGYWASGFWGDTNWRDLDKWNPKHGWTTASAGVGWHHHPYSLSPHRTISGPFRDPRAAAVSRLSSI